MIFSLQNFIISFISIYNTIQIIPIPEILTLFFSLYFLLSSSADQILLISTFLTVFTDTIFFNFEIILKIVKKVYESLFLISLYDAIYVFTLVALFFASQFLAFRLKNKNFARKNFHFLFFFLSLRNFQNLEILFEILIYFAALSCKLNITLRHFSFLMNHEKEHFAHFFLLCSLIYPRFFLRNDQFVKLIISICILDSFASIYGIYCKSIKKSFRGFLAGQLASWLVELALSGKIDFSYHFAMGIVEFYCPWNDNLIISMSSVLYQLFIQRYNRDIVEI